MRRIVLLIGCVVVLASCTSSADVSSIDPLEPITPHEVQELLATSEKPVVLNVWASWCGPCRSEAPLLRAAAAEWGDRVTFIGIDVRDTMEGARGFIAEFRLEGITHYFDRDGAVPASLGGSGVPLTFFFGPGGDLVRLHHGVIDERTLALWLDESTRSRP